MELRKAEVRWVRPSEQEAVLSEEEKETLEIFRKFQGILNKLTPQKFKDLAEQALQLPMNNPERLKGCIDKIFTKVWGNLMLCLVSYSGWFLCGVVPICATFLLYWHVMNCGTQVC